MHFHVVPSHLITRSLVDSDNVRGIQSIAQTDRILTLLHLRSIWLDTITRNICLYQDFRCDYAKHCQIGQMPSSKVRSAVKQ